MSRARWFDDPRSNQVFWFDQKSRATVEQLELLADYEDAELDDLLDEGLTQKQVLFRLRLASNTIVVPPEILERRRLRKIESQIQPTCRICAIHGWECEGRITRHHFIPRWLMKELDNYVSYAARSVCTIPLCVGRHRDLHYRGDGTGKSIVPYLRDHERIFAQKLLDELKEEHPKIYELALSGEEGQVYEAQIMHDHVKGGFLSTKGAYSLSEYDYDRVETLA
jgi:hypothetical protein